MVLFLVFDLTHKGKSTSYSRQNYGEFFSREDFKVSWYNATPGRCRFSIGKSDYGYVIRILTSKIEDQKNAFRILGKTSRDDFISTDVSNSVN